MCINFFDCRIVTFFIRQVFNKYCLTPGKFNDHFPYIGLMYI